MEKYVVYEQLKHIFVYNVYYHQAHERVSI